MARLTVPELLAVLCAWTSKHRHVSNTSDQQYVVAKFVLARMLGMQWVQDKVDSPDGTNSYIRPRPSEHVDIHRHTDRVIQLGEQLLNLQAVSGIEHVLGELRTELVESTFAVLAAASLLYKAEVSFRFVERQHRRGADYDLQLSTADGTQISCEVKCKTEARDYSDSTLTESLRTARKQLPNNAPGLVVVMVPEPWLTDRNINSAWPAVLNSVFRNTSRIAGVLFFGERWNFSSDGSAEHSVTFIHWLNENSPSCELLHREVLGQLRPVGYNQRWIYLRDLVTQDGIAE